MVLTVITLILIHVIISFFISFSLKKEVNKYEIISYFIIALLYPVGGYFLVLNFKMNSSRVDELEKEDFDEDKIILFTDHKNLDAKVLVSIEDSLLFSNTNDKRKSIIDALKRDTTAYIDRLKVALNDEDTETAHYAASAISEFRRTLDLKLQNFVFEYENDKDDEDLSYEFYEVIDEYLNSGLLDDHGTKQYYVMSTQVLENIIFKFEYKEKYIKELVYKLIEIKDFKKAKKYSDLYYSEYKTEESYISRLNFYFSIRDKRNFTIVFNELKKSPIKLGNDSLGILRFWIKDVANV